MKGIAVFALMITLPAYAHHGWSEYDANQPCELVGTIGESGYVHPHGFIRLKTAEKTWAVVLAPPTRIQNRGLSQEMLTPVTNAPRVYGFPNRSNLDELRAERITIDQQTTELR
jgi:hypothetical protein